LQGHHAAERGAESELLNVGLFALDGKLLAVALEFKDSAFGGLGIFVKANGFLQARHVVLAILDFDLGFLAVDIAEDGAFAHFNLRLGEVCHGLFKIRLSLSGVVAMLGGFLFNLMAEVFVFGCGIAQGLLLFGGVEFGEEVAFVYLDAVLYEAGERGLAAALTFDEWDLNYVGMQRLYDTADAKCSPRTQ
jgi:hypothetical protein